MHGGKLAYILSIIILISGLFTDAALPEGDNKISGIEFLTGYGHGRLRSKENYRLCPLFIDLNFDLKNGISQKFNSYPGLLQFVLEPFYSYVWNPDTNMEIGNNFAIKAGIMPQGMKFQPYFKFGAGLIYISQRTREQSTHFNFNEYAGLGAHY
ncbi:MAG: acyloxyacyl hydrolase, partial [Candidatus Omnitrophota bacterium]